MRFIGLIVVLMGLLVTSGCITIAGDAIIHSTLSSDGTDILSPQRNGRTRSNRENLGLFV